MDEVAVKEEYSVLGEEGSLPLEDVLSMLESIPDVTPSPSLRDASVSLEYGTEESPKPLDYTSLPYFNTAPEHLVASQEEYFSTTIPEKDTSSQRMDDGEAAETMEKIQRAAVLQDQASVTPEERRKFVMWAALPSNGPLLHLYEALSGITRDVDYGRVG